MRKDINVVLIMTRRVVGSILIIGGLYAVLWGKNKEMKLQEDVKAPKLVEEKEYDINSDLELQTTPYLHYPKCNHNQQDIN